MGSNDLGREEDNFPNFLLPTPYSLFPLDLTIAS